MGKITEEMKKMVEEQRLVFAATTTKDGFPNVSPKGSIRYWDENHLIFIERNSARTRNNLKENPNIALVVLDPAKRKGFQFKGQAELINKGDLFDELCQKELKERPHLGPINYVVKIAVAEVFPVPTPRA